MISIDLKLLLFKTATIELYEGSAQANNSVWSSLQAPSMPLVERQSYIIPTIVEAMRETITERGITNKHVLSKTTFYIILCEGFIQL